MTQINLGPHIRYHLVPLRESQKATWALAKPFYVFSVDIFYGTPDHEVSMKRWRSPLRKGRDVQHREVTGGLARSPELSSFASQYPLPEPASGQRQLPAHMQGHCLLRRNHSVNICKMWIELFIGNKPGTSFSPIAF